MFSKTITNSGKFLKMPATSRLFYYDLGMNADDDGYAEWFTTMRMSGASQQDLDVLRVNGFVKVFDDNVLVVLDWKENNYIPKDRYTPSKYIAVYAIDTQCIQNVDTGKVRLGKVRLENTMSVLTDAFDQFWSAYPKKELKKKAFDKWKSKKLDSKLPQILNFIEKAKLTDRWKKGFIKAPPVFLGNECWNDDLISYNDRFNSRAKTISVID